LKLGVLNNFGAGGGGERQERIKDFLRDHPDVASEVPGSGSDIGPALGRLDAQGVDVLAVNGGDGTLQNVLTLLLGDDSPFERLPILLPLRSGRTNMGALDIGSDRSPTRSLRRALGATRDNSVADRLVRRSVLRIDLGPEDGTQYGLFCGIGMIYRAIEWTHRLFPYGRSQGVFGSGIVTGSLVIRHLLGRTDDGETAEILAPDIVKIRLDGEAVAAQEFRLLIVSTMDRLFLRMRPFWGAQEAPVRLTALEPKATRKFRRIVRVLRGYPPFRVGNPNREGYLSRNVDVAELEMDCGLTIDGEMYGPKPGRVVRIAGDDRIRFVRV
jgi:hypothetical protein